VSTSRGDSHGEYEESGCRSCRHLGSKPTLEVTCLYEVSISLLMYKMGMIISDHVCEWTPALTFKGLRTVTCVCE
jgi:hypothetical protein